MNTSTISTKRSSGILSSESISVVLMSLLFAFWIDIPAVNYVYVYGYAIGSRGILTELYSVTLVLFLLVSVRFGSLQNVTKTPYIWILIIVLILFYYITDQFSGAPRIPLTMFGIFTIAALAIPSFIQVNSKIVLKAIMFFPAIGAFRANNIFFLTNEWQNSILMDTTYHFLPPVIASLIYTVFYFRQEPRKWKIITILLFVANFIFLFNIIKHGSRGATLSIILLLLFLYAARWDSSSRKIVITRKRLFVVLILLVIVLTSFYTIVSYLSRTTGFYAFNKIIALDYEGDISNGRQHLLQIAFSKFIDNPLFGHGLDRFYVLSNVGGNYPHNFMAQILYDGGIFLFLLLLPILFRFLNKFRHCRFSEYVMISFLLFISVPYATFSQDLWMHVGLWTFFGTLLVKSPFTVENAF